MLAPSVNYTLGHLEIRNPELFHPVRQRLAHILIRELLGDHRVLSVRLNLGCGICRVQFALASLPAVCAPRRRRLVDDDLAEQRQ